MSPTRPADRSTRTSAPPWSETAQSAAWRFFAVYWGSVLIVGLARPAGRTVTLAALTVLCALCSATQRILVGVGLGFVGWLFATGFVANPSGTLHLHGVGDAARLALLTAAAGLAAYLTGPRFRDRQNTVRGHS